MSLHCNQGRHFATCIRAASHIVLQPHLLQATGAGGTTGNKRLMDPEEEAKRKKRMERFGIVDQKAEAASRAEVEVREHRGVLSVHFCVPYVQGKVGMYATQELHRDPSSSLVHSFLLVLLLVSVCVCVSAVLVHACVRIYGCPCPQCRSPVAWISTAFCSWRRMICRAFSERGGSMSSGV